MSEVTSTNVVVRCGSRIEAHGSWRAGFHWPSGGEKEATVTLAQLAELKGDRNLTMVVVGRTSKPPTLREDEKALTERLRRIAEESTPPVDLSFVGDLPILDAAPQPRK